MTFQNEIEMIFIRCRLLTIDWIYCRLMGKVTYANWQWIMAEKPVQNRLGWQHVTAAHLHIWGNVNELPQPQQLMLSNSRGSWNGHLSPSPTSPSPSGNSTWESNRKICKFRRDAINTIKWRRMPCKFSD